MESQLQKLQRTVTMETNLNLDIEEQRHFLSVKDDFSAHTV